jgi:hypothetical protein
MRTKSLISMENTQDNRALARSAMREGIFGRWTISAGVEIKDGVLKATGKQRSYFPATVEGLAEHFSAVSDEKTLIRFARRFGLLAAGHNSVAAILRHASRVRQIRRLVALLTAAAGDRFRAEVKDAFENIGIEIGPISWGDVRKMLPPGEGPIPPREKRLFASANWPKKPALVVRDILHTLLTENLKDVRFVVEAAGPGQSRIYPKFDKLIDLIYWQVAEELTAGSLRKCKLPECTKIFTANAQGRKSEYCCRQHQHRHLVRRQRERRRKR